MQGLDFSVVSPYLDVIWMGMIWTAIITIAASVVSVVGGVLLAVAALYGPSIVAYPVRLFSWVFMGTPLLLQLYLIYFGLVQIGIDVPAIIAGIIGLGLHFAVYNADIFRAGILAVDIGQTEGARTIGFSRWQTLRYVVVPQAVLNTAPPVGNNLIALLKESAIVSVIGVAELVHASQLGISETYRPFEFYVVAAVLYYVLNLALEGILKLVEIRVEATR